MNDALEKNINDCRERALEYLQTLVGQKLSYGYKTDMELYIFSLGEIVERINSQGRKFEVGLFRLHALCPVEIIWKNSEMNAHIKCHSRTSNEKFYPAIKNILGLTVQQVELCENNNLWLDFGDCKVGFTTLEGEEESWRFLTANDIDSHLVASDTQLEFV